MNSAAQFIQHYSVMVTVSLFFLVAVAMAGSPLRAQPSSQSPLALALHGGAGTILKENMTPQTEAAYRAKLSEALVAGYALLRDGGHSLDAVEAAIRIMEDSPLFNAGKGAVFTSAGTNEMDAFIMDGKSLKAGAVAAVRHVKNPISLARLVMEKTWHVLLAGEGAEAFAREMAVETRPDSYFFTDKRWKQLESARQKEKNSGGEGASLFPGQHLLPEKFGTVGVVALDQFGNLAAGTSTGGMTNKRFGRVGDSPIIGAGTYADNRTCAVSGTGEGEYFIRLGVARDISALMDYRGMTLQQAADEVIQVKLPALGGEGGVIAVDQHGNIAMSFNTAGMYRGYIDKEGRPVVKIYKE